MEERLFKKFNDQMNLEYASAYIYLSMAIHFGYYNYVGIAKFFEEQYEEEIEHFHKFKKLIMDAGCQPELCEVPKPPKRFDSLIAAMEMAYDHECKVTKSIKELWKCAQEEEYYSANGVLNWFLDEQLEEEAMFAELCSVLKRQDMSANQLDIEMRRRYGIPYPSQRKE